MSENEQRLLEENRKLRSALAALLCAATCPIEGPSWATADAKRRNREMYESAVDSAFECFPDGGYNASGELARSN
jgi:hypothetical protein